MRRMSKRLTSLMIAAMFVTMQVPAAIDTGLGAGNGGAVINATDSNFTGLTKGTNSASLGFKGNSHVNWNTLNVNKGQTLNFNAENGAKGITVLNTVNQGMSNIYGQIKTNSGVGKLIISNPNGVLFDGAKFSTAGDALITTQTMNMNAKGVTTVTENSFAPAAVTIKNSDFSVGGDMNFVADTMNVVKSAFAAKNGKGDVKFTTTNGQDYVVTQSGCCSTTKSPVTAFRMEAVQIDGNVYIVSDKGIVKTVSGGDISGNLDVKSNSDYAVSLNYTNNGKTLHVKGNTNVDANTERMFIRNAKIDGNLTAKNTGGFVELGDSTVGKNATLITKKLNDITDNDYNHFVHVIGDTKVGGDLTIDSAQNIHIGGYQMDENNPKISNGDGTYYWNGKLLDGSLKVGGNLNAKTTSGHITTTVNTTAKNINYEANSTTDGTRLYGGNILTDGKAVLTANTYKFKANGYIGGLKESQYNGKTVDNQIINIMESYTNIPADIGSHDYLTINGGTVTKIETPKVSPKGNDVQVYIKSLKDVTVNGANAGVINITAPKSRIDITGDVHAKEINVGPETDYLKLDYPGRDFTTNFTSIRDEKVVTIKPNEEITYDLADGGYNKPTLKPGEKTTYLIGPGKVDPPTPPTPPDDDNVRIKNWVPDDPMQPLVNTPVAFAADLDDDDEDAAVRKNVDGSVTVVRAFPMMGN